jgi:molybdopterin-synthase adenylyltransferase
MESMQDFLNSRASGDLLPWTAQSEAAAHFNVPFEAVEELALVLGLLPARYQRNRQTISTSQQLALFRSRIAVIGCGGLGGYVLEQMARLGVGTIVAVDPDVFEEHNLNRQLLATPATLGRAKVDAAVVRIAEINPAVTVIAHRTAYGPANGAELLRGSDLVIDALDSISTRLELSDSCADLGLPLVHGAIGGWYGQVTTQYPGDDTLQQIYRHWQEGKGVEQQLGNPAFTPAAVASIQVAEACKVLLGEGETLRRRKLVINLLDMEFEEIHFGRHLAVVGE